MFVCDKDWSGSEVVRLITGKKEKKDTLERALLSAWEDVELRKHQVRIFRLLSRPIINVECISPSTSSEVSSFTPDSADRRLSHRIGEIYTVNGGDLRAFRLSR